jgi:hypothetical protein
MAKLKLGPLIDDKPVRLTVELPAQVHRDLVTYAEVLGRETVTDVPLEPAKLIGPMLARFMNTDRAFAKARRSVREGSGGVPTADLTAEYNGRPGEHG